MTTGRWGTRATAHATAFVVVAGAFVAFWEGACGSVESPGASTDAAADAAVVMDAPSERSVLGEETGGDGGNGSDGGSPLCAAPPVSEGGSGCVLPPYSAQVFTIVLWVDDATAPGGGSRATLRVGGSIDLAGHTYHNAAGGLFGGGAGGIYGDAFLDVDGKVNALQFHMEGCAIDDGNGKWEVLAALTRSSSLCAGCTPRSIARHYSIVRAVGPDDAGICPGMPSCVTYTFTADEPPITCGFGVDLLGLVLSGS